MTPCSDSLPSVYLFLILTVHTHTHTDRHNDTAMGRFQGNEEAQSLQKVQSPQKRI